MKFRKQNANGLYRSPEKQQSDLLNIWKIWEIIVSFLRIKWSPPPRLNFFKGFIIENFDCISRINFILINQQCYNVCFILCSH